MKYLLLLVFFFFSCYAPQKEWYEVRNVSLVEIHKTEIGFELIWDDGSREVKQFIVDTSGCHYKIGSIYMAFIPR